MVFSKINLNFLRYNLKVSANHLKIKVEIILDCNSESDCRQVTSQRGDNSRVSQDTFACNKWLELLWEQLVEEFKKLEQKELRLYVIISVGCEIFLFCAYIIDVSSM